MTVDDIPKVFHLGESLYSASKLPFLYRTWDPYEVAYLFSSETDLSIVAEIDNTIVGFCLSTTVEKPNKPWRYGYLIWLGVSTETQSRGIGKRLLNETSRRMKQKKVKFMLIDTEEGNVAAVKFFEKMGYEIRHRQVWMWRNFAKAKITEKTLKSSVEEVALRRHVRKAK
jgi:ribosomal protein S18 acetylase RimI-like enzyme